MMWYKYTTIEHLPQILKSNKPAFCKTDKKGESMMNTPISFDIEITSHYHNGEKYAFMYMWGLDIFDTTIIGRTYAEFIEALQMISNHFDLSPEKRAVIYVHNLSFDFQFFRKWLQWKKIFAIDERKPLYGITENGFEFRCSYLLTGYKLETVGENLRNKIDKMTGTLNYDLCRHFKTEISDDEIQYLIHDCKIVSQCVRERIEDENGICNIPLTKTGYVRRLCRARCMNGKNGRDYRQMISSLTLSSNEYVIARRAFAGGFTHANYWQSKKHHHNVTSMDFCSSYPAVMISEMYPCSKGKLIENCSKEDFYYYCKNKLCIFKIELHDVQNNFPYEDYISRSHCSVCESNENLNVIVNNGRIHTAGRIITVITNIDFEIINSIYLYDKNKMRYSDLYVYDKYYLPSDFVECIIELYEKKTELKGIPEKIEEYMNAKENVNALYGMCVTDIFRELFEYDCNDNMWEDEKPKEERKTETDEEKAERMKKSIEKENAKKGRFLFYLWGVFVTAYARRNLFTAIIECKSDYIYSDTDSVKILNFENHKKYFEKYNAMVSKKIEKALKSHNINPERAKPKTIKGKEKPLGIWEFDGFYTDFKTLGAKRYMCRYENSEYLLTVAGVSKQNAMNYLLEVENKTGKTVWEQFEQDLLIPAEHTGKKTHTYIDDEFTIIVKDYQGNYATVHEKSCIHLSGAEYHLDLTGYQEFLDYINGIKDIFD